MTRSTLFTAALFAAGLLLCLHGGPVRAETAITTALVCKVQNAIRWQERAWDAATCERVSAALNATVDPVTLFAVCINESDLRPTAIDAVKPDVYDVGLCGVRCHVVAGKCADGPARGLTLQQLFDPVRNIEIAAQVMAEKRAKLGRHYLRGYNGGTREHGYGAKIGVIAAALGGARPVSTKGLGHRLAELLRQILMVTGERKTGNCKQEFARDAIVSHGNHNVARGEHEP